MKRLTLKALSDSYGYDGLLKRVIKQAGISLSDEDALLELRDIARHGAANMAVHGFTYYRDTAAFYEANRAAIMKRVADMANELGMPRLGFIVGMLDDVSEDDVFDALTDKDKDNDVYTLVSNVLSWFILEDVAAFITDRDN